MDRQNLSDIPLFQGLGLEEIELLDDYLSSLMIKSGETLFAEGDRGDYVCFVLAGSLDVYKQNINGQETMMAHVSAGRSIGEMSLIDQMQRSATVKAGSDCSLSVLSHEAFQRLLQEQPAIGAKILNHIARNLSYHLRKTSNQLTDVLDEPI